MADLPQLTVEDAAAWCQWLSLHHADSSGVWLVLPKKGGGLAGPSYAEAVDEALCFGWIDSIVRTLDDRRYQQKFTPRKPTSEWSSTNAARVQRLRSEGRMEPPGLALVPAGIWAPDTVERLAAEEEAHRRRDLPEDYVATLQSDAAAWSAWQALAPSHRRQYSAWILEAKREETRQRRLEQTRQILASGEKLPMK